MDGTGIWTTELRFHDDAGEIADAAAELEGLGYTAIWIPGGMGGDLIGPCRDLLAATRTVTVATGILNIWATDPETTQREVETLDERFLLGLGVSHPQAIRQYRRPLGTMREFLDGLDVPRDRMVIAALGPKMTDLARDRTAGSHPYFVPVEHTAWARERLGDGPVLAPECAVVLETDPGRARELARTHMQVYLGLTNYTNNLLRHGFAEDDLRDGGSDRLVDALVAWGDDEAIARRLQEHRDAGADHVCWQVLHDGGGLPREQWRRLAGA